MKFLALLLLLATSAFSSEAFWKVQRKGTNFFNNHESSDRFRAAKEAGIQFVRLAPNKWLNGRDQKELGNFLLGPPDSFNKDIAYLKLVLDEAHKSDLKVIITMLSLPGSRWAQHNKGVEDRRIWQEDKWQDEAAHFWKELARGLKDHPAVAGYNVRNEPSPELVEPKLGDWYTGNYETWYKRVKGSPADLNRFYQKVVQSIREVDQKTTIVLDSGFYATPWAFKVLEPLSDKHILYSFHMYEPYLFTSHKNKGRYKYPGKIPIGEGDAEKVKE